MLRTTPGGSYAQIIAMSAVLLVATLMLIQPPVLKESLLSRKRELAAPA